MASPDGCVVHGLIPCQDLDNLKIPNAVALDSLALSVAGYLHAFQSSASQGLSVPRTM